MRSYVEIGVTPIEEPCAQLGSPEYVVLARYEANLYRQQLMRQFPSTDFRLKSCPHDFGSYLDIFAYYDEDDADEVEAAFAAESSARPTWDDDLLLQLKEHAVAKGFVWTKEGYRPLTDTERLWGVSVGGKVVKYGAEDLTL